MKMYKFIIVLLLLSLSCILMADPSLDSWLVSLNSEFSDNEMTCAPIAAWEAAGSNAAIDSLFIIDVTSIPDSITYLQMEVDVPIPDAQTGDGFDNSPIINGLIDWLKDRPSLHGIHAQIYIPPGVYNFSDQIVMHSNIRRSLHVKQNKKYM
nr:hypothetical protein [Candidatus Cloacimonadota bacterium]